jgi:DNA helicase INO80
MSRHYSSRIARIPPPPPPPSPPPGTESLSVDDDLLSTLHPDSPQDHDYRYGMDVGGYVPMEGRGRPFGHAAEDAAREVEESILGHSNALALAGLGDNKPTTKRHASGAVSDGSSDLDIPIPFRKGLGPANKRRRLDRDDDIMDALDRAIAGQSLPLALNPFKYEAKGKGKQIQREVSLDSVSTAPKAPRRKPGPRTKLDTLPPETLDSLGLGASMPASAVATPSVSRLSSPALTASTVVFEIGEAIPPLKRAKRVDDNAMLKRIKALEEAQRKVWTNIARRDVAKVIA